MDKVMPGGDHCRLPVPPTPGDLRAYFANRADVLVVGGEYPGVRVRQRKPPTASAEVPVRHAVRLRNILRMKIDSARHNDNNRRLSATIEIGNMASRTVLFIGYDGVGLLDLTGPFTVFWSASLFLTQRGEVPYDRRVATVKGGPVATADGITFLAEALSNFDDVPIDTLVVPGALDLSGAMQDPALIDWIARNAPRARRVCSVCTGTFVLAQAGLLEGKRVVTHWQGTEALRRQFPNLTVLPDAMFVRDDPVWSSAGVSAGIDLALALVQEDCGREIAMSVARQLVVYIRRPGGQTQFSELLQPTAKDGEPFAELHDWLATHLHDETLSVESLARRACCYGDFAMNTVELLTALLIGLALMLLVFGVLPRIAMLLGQMLG